MKLDELHDSIKCLEQLRLEYQRDEEVKKREGFQYLIDLENDFSQAFSENCKDYLIGELRRSFLDIDSDNAMVIANKIYNFCYEKYHSQGYFSVLEECQAQLKLLIDVLYLFT